MTRHNSQRGAALVELAMVIPVLLMVLTAIAEFGMVFRSYEIATNAVREGARLGALPGNEENDYQIVRDRVDSYLADAALPGLPGARTITVTPENMVIGTLSVDGVRVTVTYSHTTVFLGLAAGLLNGTFSATVTHTSSALMRVQVAGVGL